MACVCYVCYVCVCLCLCLSEYGCAGKDHNLLSDNKDLGEVGRGYYDKTVLEDR